MRKVISHLIITKEKFSQRIQIIKIKKVRLDSKTLYFESGFCSYTDSNDNVFQRHPQDTPRNNIPAFWKSFSIVRLTHKINYNETYDFYKALTFIQQLFVPNTLIDLISTSLQLLHYHATNFSSLYCSSWKCNHYYLHIQYRVTSIYWSCLLCSRVVAFCS